MSARTFVRAEPGPNPKGNFTQKPSRPQSAQRTVNERELQHGRHDSSRHAHRYCGEMASLRFGLPLFLREHQRRSRWKSFLDLGRRRTLVERTLRVIVTTRLFSAGAGRGVGCHSNDRRCIAFDLRVAADLPLPGSLDRAGLDTGRLR